MIADPSGALPFAVIEADGVTIATDNLTPALCRAIGFEIQIDWSSLVATLVAPAAAVHLPHLIGLRPSVAGRLHRLDDPSADTVIWSPANFARMNDWSGTAIREAVDRSTGKLGTPASAVQLSGGLDSSIVLSSLCRGGRTAPAINYATMAAGGDERRYAAEIAQRYFAPLTTCEAARLPCYEPLFTQGPGSHPFIYGLDDAFEDAVAFAAQQAGCDRLLTGQGGDAVFFQPATALVAVDRLRAFGYEWRSYYALLDDARRTRSTIWHHLLPAIADRFRPAAVPTQKVGPVDLDPCAHPMSPVVAAQRIMLAEGGDGLADDWSGRLAFVNPPYSTQLDWLKRAYQQWSAGHVKTVVCLVPVRTDNRFFHETLHKKSDLFLLKGRLRFASIRGDVQPTPFSLWVVTLGATTEQKARFADLVCGCWFRATAHRRPDGSGSRHDARHHARPIGRGRLGQFRLGRLRERRRMRLNRRLDAAE